MKKHTKIIAITLAAVFTITSITLGLVFGLRPKKDDGLIRVNEVTHSIFYAPFYTAINKGYFQEYDIKIELTNGGGSDASMAALVSGSADVALAGPETAVYVNKQGKQNAPRIFGALTKKDGSFIVARDTSINKDSWTVSSLANKEILAGRPGGMPAMTLQYVLENAGMTLASQKETGKVHFNLEHSFAAMGAVFTGGTGDYATFFEPVASQMEKDGKGVVVKGIGELSAEIPYTVFMTNQNYLSKNTEKLTSFLKAIKKAYDFLYSATDAEIVAALKPSFTTTSDDIIVSSINRYKAIDAWFGSPILSETAFDNLQNVLVNAKTLELPKVGFSKVVDNSLAALI